MENRLQFFKRSMFLIAFCWIAFSNSGLAQPFTFNYTGVDSFYVDANCEAPLDWGHPATVTAQCNTPGCAITFFDLISISGAYNIGDPIPVGTQVIVTYRAEDDANNVSFYGFPLYFVDGIAPVFDAASLPPATISYDCISQAPAYTLTATDNCSAFGAVTITETTSTVPTDCVGGTYSRIWTATDPSGNSTSYVQTVTLNPDNAAPVISGSFVDGATFSYECNSNSSNAATYNIWFSNQLADFTASVSDPNGCGGGNLTITPQSAPAFDAGQCGTTTVIFTATDDCNNIATASANFEIIETTPISILDADGQNILLQCNLLTNDPLAQIATYPSNFTVIDGCGVANWSSNFTGLVGGCGGNTGTASVVYTVTDACGNSDNITVNFNVLDSNPPNITDGAVDITIECDGVGNVADLTTWINTRAGAISQDVCTPTPDIIEGLNVPSDPNTDDPFVALQNAIAAGCTGTNTAASITVEFTYTDLCNNTSTTDADFTIIDNSIPTITFPAAIATINCTDQASLEQQLTTWVNTAGGAQGTDACSAVSFRADPTAADALLIFQASQAVCGRTGTVTVDFYISDGCGTENPMPTTASFNVVDLTDPVWTAGPADITVECDGTNDPGANISAWLANNGGGAAADDCSAVAITHDYVGVANGCGASGSTVVTFTATDACGNTTPAIATVFIVDTTAPVWTSNPISLTIACDGTADPGGNIGAWLIQNGGGVAADACGAITYTHNYTGIGSSCGASGSTTVTFTATDACGLASTQTADITIVDNDPPTLTSPAFGSVEECDGAGNAAGLNAWLANNGGAAATDNCGDVTWTNNFTGLSDLCGGTGSATVIFVGTDPCGLTVQDTATFTIADTNGPTIFDQAADITVECTTIGTQITDWVNLHGGATATDNCSLIDNSAINSGTSSWSAISQGFVPGCGNSGSETYVFTVTDACGLSNTTSATITTFDNISPEINPTSTDFFEACGGGDDQAALEAWINNTGGALATDGCGIATWVQIDWQTDAGVVGTGDPFLGPYPTVTGGDCAYVVEVTFTVEDECDNTSTTTSSFWILDQIDPVFGVVPADITVECSTVPVAASPTATDNCDTQVIVTMDEVRTDGACDDNYTLTRTWTASDDCGNVTTAAQVITVQDTTMPSMVGVPGNTVAECDNIPTPGVIGTDVTGVDNCDTDVTITFAETTTQGTDVSSCDFYSYAITRTWTATDNCGNVGTQSQTITIQDTTDPTFTTPVDVTVECDQANNLGFTGDLVFFEDNCDAAPTVASSDVISAGTCPNSYTITRTWTVTDACGNVGLDVQIITVMDTVGPNITTSSTFETLACGDGTDPDAAFATWIANNGNAVATDNCGTVSWFAAVPGSYDLLDPATWPGTPVGGLDMASCPSTTTGVFRSETVDFIAYDECGNAAFSSSTFSVTDDTPPVFQNCPADVTVGSDPGTCQAGFSIVPPIIIEDCANTMSNLNYVDYEVITSPNPGDDMTPVNPVQLDFAVIPSAPAVATMPVTVTIDLINTDAEQNTEFFIITGEDGSVLGQTLNSANQCDDVTTVITISATLFNAWTTDGTLTLVLTPNIPAGQSAIFAINDICPQGPPTGGGSAVSASLDYVSSSPIALDYKYSINGGPNVFVNPIAAITEVLPVGVNTITYCATDCAGNSSFCTYTVTVEDSEPPSITCPADITLTVGPNDNCADGVQTTLPLPTNMFDNCGFGGNYNQTQPSNASDALLSFTYNPNYLDYVADDKQFNFLNTAANAAGSTVAFTVTVVGDVESAEEFFTLYDETGAILGTTEVGQANVVVTPGNCTANPAVHGMSVTTITVPVATYNMWAADGTVTIDAVSNNSFALPPPGIAGDGINPSCTTFAAGTPNGTTDGVSSISVGLDYTFVTPSYSVTGATVVPQTSMFPPSVAPIQSFNGGVSNVCYQIMDGAGNEAECCFDVTVIDNTPPTVLCQPTTVFVNPSGIGSIAFDPTTIDAGSFDNCGIDTMYASPDVIDCTMAGSSVNITLTVIDVSGNMATCSTPVNISTEGPTPAFGLGICGNSDLQLFANPPAANGGVVYTYAWSGPNGFMSNQENPIISNVVPATAGFYTVTITGFSGCTSQNTIEVIIPPNTNTPVLAISDNSICTNGSATLSTQFYPGTSVTYNWYTGFAPNGTLIGSTASQNFSISNATPGVFNYYVIVDVDGCISNESNNQALTVDMGVIATTNDTALNVCEGEQIILGTNTSCGNCTYQWNGPNGFTSSAQFPTAFNSVNASEGTYSLTIFSNGCPSSAVTTEVNVFAAPPTPQVAVSGLGCEGDDIMLTANIPNAATYTWVSPTFATTTTLTNTLTIFNASSADIGNWTVFTSGNGCDSQTSAPAFVTVESTFSVNASNDGPSCVGSSVLLNTNNVVGANYEWTGPNGFVSFAQNPTAPAVAGTYTVVVTSTAGCEATAATTVTTQAAPDVTAISNNGTSCAQGQTVTLVPTVFPIDPGSYSYSWTGPNGYVSNMASPTLPNATSNDNGNYILTVSNGSGCVSSVMSTNVNITDAPATPTIGMQSALCEGDNMSLTTNSYAGTNVTYTWTTPQGVFTTVTPILNVANVLTADAGDYSVMVSVDGCDSFDSGIMPVSVFQMPPLPTASVSGNCANDDIQLFTTPIAGASYLWTGPNGFTSTIANPMIMNASAADEGNYSVQVVIGSCVSSVSAPLYVPVDAAPASPIAMNSGGACVNDPNSSVILEVDPSSTVPGATYTWHEGISNQVVGTPSTSWTQSIPNLSAYPPGTYSFYVVSSLNGCTSEPSIFTTVELSEIPNVNAFAGTDINFCGDGVTDLNATAPAVGTGTWTQTSGPAAVIANPTSSTSTVTGLVAGNAYTFMWTLSSGACGDYDSDEVVINVETATDVASATSFDACDVTSVNLSATAPSANVTGMWTQPAAQAALGVVISNPTDPNSAITGLQSNNNYTFTWTLSNAACGEFSTATSIVEVLESGAGAFAGADQTICDGNDAILNATLSGSGNGSWESLDTDVSVSTPNQPMTVVFNLQPGANTFIWTVDNGVCGESEDEMVIFVEGNATATDDTYTVPFNGNSMTLDVIANDIAPSAGYVVTIVNSPSSGTVTVNNDGTIDYLANTAFAGTDVFTYLICSTVCDVCDEATVNLVVGEDAECEAPSIITPNNDGINDAFQVPCLAGMAYENNEVVIFNQWGDEVYRKKQYLNDWEGTYDGSDLPASTYFYIIDLGDNSEPMTGFLVIER